MNLTKHKNRVAVVGSRMFGDYETLCKVLDEVSDEIGGINLIVSGGAMGADSLSERYAEEHDIQTVELNLLKSSIFLCYGKR